MEEEVKKFLRDEEYKLFLKIFNEVKKEFERVKLSSHDFSHVMRVLNNAIKIIKNEKIKVNYFNLFVSILLHDLGIVYEKKNDIKEVKYFVMKYNLSEEIINIVNEHAFSKGAIPSCIESKILQDADWLDALGSIGIARVFSFSHSRKFYNIEEPVAKNRKLNDEIYALDHFYKKLFKIRRRLNFDWSKKEARRREKIMKAFIKELLREIR